MKQLRFWIILIFTIAAVPSWGWVSTPTAIKEYGFKFKMTENEKYEYVTKANTYEDAFEKAAQACFNHFKGGRRVSEDRGLAIIDVCANPRTL